MKALLGCDAGRDEINYRQKEQLEATNEIFGNTPLHVAACLGNKEIVKTILNTEHGQLLLKKENMLRDTPAHMLLLKVI